MLRMAKLALHLSLVIGLCPAAAWGQSPSPAVNIIPSDAVICIEVLRPRELLNLLTGEEMSETITGLPFYQKLSANPGFVGLLSAVNFMEASLATEWRDALKVSAGGGITFAVCPGETAVLILDAEDESLPKRIHDLLVTMVRSDAQNKSLPDPVERAEFLGVTGWSFNGKESHALIGRRLIFSNNPEGLKRVLTLRAESEGFSFASRTDYQEAQRAVGADTTARVFLNLRLLKSIPGVANALEQDKSNPLAALFLSGIVEALRNSDWLWLGLDVVEQGLSLRAVADGKATDPNSPAAFAQPTSPEQGAMPNLSTPRRIAAFSFYRDLHRFYSAKDALFPERTSQLIFFENMMGIFFSGRDLTDEVLSEATPALRFVVARQAYDQATGVPQVQLPAFAAILRLRDTETFDEVLEEAWQKAVGLINFTRGQQAMPGLIIDRPIHGGMKFTAAYFSTAGLDQKTNLHTRFNLRPSLAMPEDYLILSSTDALARDLIDALTIEAQGPRAPLPGIHSVAELDGAQLGSILKANYETLVRQNMVKEGSTQEQAEANIGVFIALTSLVKHVNLRMGSQGELTEARASIDLNLE